MLISSQLVRNEVGVPSHCVILVMEKKSVTDIFLVVSVNKSNTPVWDFSTSIVCKFRNHSLVT